MTFYEALQILGLDSNFTEEELRKKYLNLAKTYHPDALIGKPEEEIKAASEKMKDINLAYETLKKDKRNSYSDKTATNNGWDFNYWNNLVNIIKKYDFNNIDSKYEFTDIASRFKSFFNRYYLDIMLTVTKEEVDKLFSEFKKGVKDWYIKLKDIYFKKHNIPENTNFTINEDLSFDEFYNNLEKTKEQHQNNIKKEVKYIVDKYKLYAYYYDLETKIEELMQGTITAILDIPYTGSNFYLNNKNYYLNHLKNDIDFNNYDEAVRIFDKVKRNLITLKDIEVSICKDDTNGLCVKDIQIDDKEYNIFSYNDETCIIESYRILGSKITLDEFMEKAEEFFVTFTWNDDDIVALYRFDSIILGIYKGRLEFFKDIEVTNVEVQNEKNLGIYQDREYVKSMIINEYYKEIELHKKQNNTIKK